jgi:hypothetical protein
MAYDMREHFAAVKYNGRFGFINNKGQEITEMKYDDWHYFKNGFAWIGGSDEHTFINSRGKEITSPKYYVTTDFYNGRAIVWGKEKFKTYEYGVIDTNGTEIIPVKYQNILVANPNMFSVEQNYRTALFDWNGNPILADTSLHINDGKIFIYDWPINGTFHYNGLAHAQVKGKKGAINEQGKAVVPFIYDKLQLVYPYPNQFLYKNFPIIKRDAFWGILDSVTYKEICMKECQEVFRLYGKNFLIKIENKFGIMDEQCNLLVPAKYKAVQDAHGKYIVKEKKKYAVIDEKQNIILGAKYDSIVYNGNFFFVKRKRKWGIVDFNNKILAKCKYTNFVMASWDISGLAKKNKFKLVNKDGKILSENIYEKVEHLFGNKVNYRICLNGKWALLNNDAQLLTEIKYDYVSDQGYPMEGFYPVSINKKHGYIDVNGKEVIPLKYDYTDGFRNGICKVGYLIPGMEEMPDEYKYFYFYVDKYGNEYLKK